MTGTATHTPSDTTIHRTAEVGPEVTLGKGVAIGPRCTIEGRVHLGDGVRLIGDIYIYGPAEIGSGTTIYPYGTLGTPGQDRKFKPGDPTAGIRVGSDCVLRESFTMHAATKISEPTSIGDRCMCMVGAHLGHDVSVGHDVTMVNGVALGGHCRVDDRANLSGAVMVHQFTRIGTLALVTGGVIVTADVPPFCLVGDRNRVSGLNRIGLRRSGMSRDEIDRISRAFRAIFSRHMQKGEIIATLEAMSEGSPAITEMHRWFSAGRRSFCDGPSRLPRWFSHWLRTQRRDGDLFANSEHEAFDDSDGNTSG